MNINLGRVVCSKRRQRTARPVFCRLVLSLHSSNIRAQCHDFPLQSNRLLGLTVTQVMGSSSAAE